jgi:hypothetical protein
MEENAFKFPTETVELPSKGLLYPEEHPLASGKVEMKYMTAKEEDILTNQNYISQGVVLDKLLQSLIVTKVNYDDLFVGDKNAIMIASRILGYGKDYEFEYNGEDHTIDLSTLDNKPIDESLFTRGKNDFEFQLPFSKTNITFQLLDGHLEKKIDAEIRGLKKVNKTSSPELSTRMKHIITSVDGNRDTKSIRDFVDNYFLARDSRALRQHISDFQPDIDLEINIMSQGEDKVIELPIGVNFFFPDA